MTETELLYKEETLGVVEFQELLTDYYLKGLIAFELYKEYRNEIK